MLLKEYWKTKYASCMKVTSTLFPFVLVCVCVFGKHFIECYLTLSSYLLASVWQGQRALKVPEKLKDLR